MKKDINKLVESFFAKKENVITESLLEDLVRKQFKALSEAYVKGGGTKGYGGVGGTAAPARSFPKDMTIKYSFIPEISVSEIGWSSLDTSGATPVASPQRQQLFDYLKNISGGTFGEKVKTINSFYTDSIEELEAKGLLSKTSNSSRIQTIMSYLVFLKTLTTIITNFNAASAGFSFESFLGVLLEGQQVKTGSGTIADLVTKDGINISLKLYAEDGVHVGGSFNDLVNDMVGVESLKIPQKPFIRYVVATKRLEGEGLDRKGSITVYQFDINLNNFASVLFEGGEESKKCIRLPSEFIKSGRDFSSLKKVAKTEKELRDHFQKLVNSNSGLKTIGDIKGVVDVLQKAEKMPYKGISPLFQNTASQKNKEFGKSSPNKKSIKSILIDLQNAGTITKTENPGALSDIFREIYDEVVFFNKGTKPETELQVEATKKPKKEPAQKEWEVEKELIPSLKFASTPDSVAFYNKASPEMKMKALRNMYGYLQTEQFGFTFNQVLKAIKLPGQEYNDAIGTIEVGRQNVEVLINKMIGELNSQIFEIFDSLNLVTSNINSYFATGMKDDNAADTAQIAAANIDKKTEEVQQQAKA